MEKGESMGREHVEMMKGTWHRVAVPDGMELPSEENRECSIASVFYDSPVYSLWLTVFNIMQ